MNTSDISNPMFAERVQTWPPYRQAALQARLRTHGARLGALFCQLYPPEQYPGTLTRLIDTLLSRLQSRSDDLFALDEHRIQNPDWFTQSNQMGYMAYTDRFAGTLRGVQSRIPHLRSLGVTYLHLLPFLKARQGDNDGGFAVASFTEIEPSLGTRDDLEALTAQLRTAGISLCSDIVLNHVADDHPWVQKAQAGDSHYREYFYLFKKRADVDAFETTLNQVFPETAPGNFTWNDATQEWVWTTFYPYQWDLNYRNPNVFIDMIDAMLDLANLGIEAFRLDSAGYLWKQLGTACMNLPQTHTVLQCLRACFDLAAPAVLLKAEAIVPTRDLPPYFGVGASYTPQCHLAYHSSLMTAIWLSIAEQSSDLLRRVIAGTPALPPASSWITYIRCHDDIGWNVLRPELSESGDHQFARLKAAARFMNGEDSASFSSGRAFQAAGSDRVHGSNGMTASLLGLEKADPESTLARLNLVFGLICTIGGLPVIYMGDEWAQGNAEHLPDSTWAAEDGRRLQRPFWDDALTHSTQSSLHQRQFAQLKGWQRLRAAHPELAAHQRLELLPCKDPHVIAFRRASRITVVANLSGHTAILTEAERSNFGLEQATLRPWSIRLEKTPC